MAQYDKYLYHCNFSVEVSSGYNIKKKNKCRKYKDKGKRSLYQINFYIFEENECYEFTSHGIMVVLKWFNFSLHFIVLFNL